MATPDWDVAHDKEPVTSPRWADRQTDRQTDQHNDKGIRNNVHKKIECNPSEH
jgi:hypothetical protein